MRPSMYKLTIEEGRKRNHDNGNQRTLYTGGKMFSALLDEFKGERVKIVGKPYDIVLEGINVSEIWVGWISRLN
jgi:hypothetical protein